MQHNDNLLDDCRAWALLVDDEGATLIGVQVATTDDEIALVATADLGVHWVPSCQLDDHPAYAGLPLANWRDEGAQADLVLCRYHSNDGRSETALYVGLVDDVPSEVWVAHARQAATGRWHEGRWVPRAGHLTMRKVRGSTIVEE